MSYSLAQYISDTQKHMNFHDKSPSKSIAFYVITKQVIYNSNFV